MTLNPSGRAPDPGNARFFPKKSSCSLIPSPGPRLIRMHSFGKPLALSGDRPARRRSHTGGRGVRSRRRPRSRRRASSPQSRGATRSARGRWRRGRGVTAGGAFFPRDGLPALVWFRLRRQPQAPICVARARGIGGQRGHDATCPPPGSSAPLTRRTPRARSAQPVAGGCRPCGARPQSGSSPS